MLCSGYLSKCPTLFNYGVHMAQVNIFRKVFMFLWYIAANQPGADLLYYIVYTYMYKLYTEIICTKKATQ